MHFECDISSIHFPHPREDSNTLCNIFQYFLLQSTSLIRGKTILDKTFVCVSILQSTSLIRGKTPCRLVYYGCVIFFNPLPSSEGRLMWASPDCTSHSSSIHFPHPREDRADHQTLCGDRSSIHFPHPREDLSDAGRQPGRKLFNPLPSSEGRQQNFLILFSNPNIFLVHLYNFIFYLSNSQKNQEIPQ